MDKKKKITKVVSSTGWGEGGWLQKEINYQKKEITWYTVYKKR